MILRLVLLCAFAVTLAGCGGQGYQQRQKQIDPETVNVQAPGPPGQENAPAQPPQAEQQ